MGIHRSQVNSPHVPSSDICTYSHIIACVTTTLFNTTFSFIPYYSWWSRPVTQAWATTRPSPMLTSQWPVTSALQCSARASTARRSWSTGLWERASYGCRPPTRTETWVWSRKLPWCTASLRGNASRITAPLWGENAYHRWITHTMDQ